LPIEKKRSRSVIWQDGFRGKSSITELSAIALKQKRRPDVDYRYDVRKNFFERTTRLLEQGPVFSVLLVHALAALANSRSRLPSREQPGG
jgi:hypothetical protein